MEMKAILMILFGLEQAVGIVRRMVQATSGVTDAELDEAFKRADAADEAWRKAGETEVGKEP